MSSNMKRYLISKSRNIDDIISYQSFDMNIPLSKDESRRDCGLWKIIDSILKKEFGESYWGYYKDVNLLDKRIYADTIIKGDGNAITLYLIEVPNG